MLTFDAFAFTQVTFLAFVLIGISGVAVHLRTSVPCQELSPVSFAPAATGI